MKLIIAGTRDLDIGFDQLLSFFSGFGIKEINEIISGNSGLVDMLGIKCSEEYDVPAKLFTPDWEKHGKAAGPIRNREMAEYANALLLIWDGESKGSRNMREEMLKRNKRVYEVIIRKPK